MYEMVKLDETDIKPEVNTDITIHCEVRPCFSYAAYQNDIAIITALSIKNNSEQDIVKCVLELESEPHFFKQKQWTIEKIEAGTCFEISSTQPDFNISYLQGLNEAERGVLRFRLLAEEKEIADYTALVRLLACDEWGGVDDMGRLLPCFVMPNSKAVAKIGLLAAERLKAHNYSSALDGYQSGERQRPYLLAAAVYSAITDLGIHYAEPPISFEKQGQKIRKPETIVADKLATCLDSSLLIASSLEMCGLYPVIIILKRHALVGVWLQERNFPSAVIRDPMEVRKALAGGELIVFETTGITQSPPMLWEQAIKIGRAYLDEDKEADFVAAIDVHYARSSGVFPLASHTTAGGGAVPGGGEAPEPEGGPVPLPSPGDVPCPIPEDPVPGEEKPKTPQGRIDAWSKRLLDLTLRNRLLNFSETKRVLKLLCFDIKLLEQKLANDEALKFVSLPENNPHGKRDEGLFLKNHKEGIDEKFVKEALHKKEIVSPLAGNEMQARLIELYRQVKNDLAESGTNTLFLAMGFLRWKKTVTEERVYKAPLLLLPVSLARKSVSAPFYLKQHEDEPHFNATLLEFLERDFGLNLSYLKQIDKPDIAQILAQVRQAIRQTAGMEVVEEVAVSTFSFTKFLMWKDLVERTDSLRQNRVVRHLIDNPEEEFKTGESRIKGERPLDTVLAPQDIISILPADSSQISASVAAADGEDFVLIGPPGTGKSQTIANIIAHCLSARKTVLFVAEKTAALNVVYRRLYNSGLGDYCLELHSNKADKRHFLDQMEKSWESRQAFSEEQWLSINEKLRINRDRLNIYAASLHRPYANGLTPFAAFGLKMRGEGHYAPKLHWDSPDIHDKKAYDALKDLAGELGRVFNAVKRKDFLHLVNKTQWTHSWQEELVACVADVRKNLSNVKAQAQHIKSLFDISDCDAILLRDLPGLADFLKKLAVDRQSGRAILFDADFNKMRAAIEQLQTELNSYREAEGYLSAQFAEDMVNRIPLEDLDKQWRTAEVSFFFKKWLGKRRVRKILQTYAKAGKVNPKDDLLLLHIMQKGNKAVAANEIAAKFEAFSGVGTDIKAVQTQFDRASILRNALYNLGSAAEKFSARLRPILEEPEAHHNIFELAQNFTESFDNLAGVLETYEKLSGVTNSWQSGETIGTLAEKMENLQNAGNILRDWASWCATSTEARGRGLQPLVEDLEAGKIEPEMAADLFELSYIRWWTPLILDKDPVLRDFQPVEHEYIIKNFRKIDEKIRENTAARVIHGIDRDLPEKDRVAPKSELGFLRRQLGLKRPRNSIRQMIGAMPGVFPKLAPCLLMSPLSIAQYLPAEQALFDVVIFDEASQITTWDAIGAIARARQTIIVGDPKQLPPTNFFGRKENDDYAENDTEKDLESILDEVRAAGIPTRNLRWHYRSRHESLISFSNYHYYDNTLITFPSPTVEDRAVSLISVDGIYDRGKSRTNKIEAEAVAAKAVELMEEWLEYDEKDRKTLGIITFNVQQQQLIEDILEKKCLDNPALEWFFADDRIEPVIVKNLENIQGDERDVILFSITFNKDAAGKRTLSFGALNKEGGERRLNVAVTRARHQLMVFSGFGAEHIDIEKTKSLGVRQLKTFLDFAKRGAVALNAPVKGSQGGHDSPFEAMVARELERLGWQLVPQVGISGFRIDIGVKHPDHPGSYLAGIECDGATYHSSASARDRDKVREEVLTGLGWNIIRVWSTSWWFDAKGEVEKLDKALKNILAQNRVLREDFADAEAGEAVIEQGHAAL